MQVFSRALRMKLATARVPTSFSNVSRTATTLAGENSKGLLMGSAMEVSRSPIFFSSSAQLSLLKGELMSQDIQSTFGRGRAFCTAANSNAPPSNQPPAQNQASPPPPPPVTPPPPPP
eukprot:c12642_g1_i1 orf=222-575(+)